MRTKGNMEDANKVYVNGGCLDAGSPGMLSGNGALMGKLGSTLGGGSSLADYAKALQPRGDARFHALLKRIGDLHDLKQADYGSNADPFANVRASADFGIRGWVGCMVRANDKMKRIQKFAKSETLKNESVQDSLMDLAVYSLIALVLFEEENPPICNQEK